MVGPRFGPDFPWTKGLALACITLSESVCSTVLYPFVPFMVRDFGVPDDNVGFYAGLLASAYNIAQIPAGIFWGKMSDLFGRRPVLFIGLIGQSLGMLGLGLYGAPDPRKSLNYCGKSRNKFMFICRFNLSGAQHAGPGTRHRNTIFDEFCVYDERHVVVLWMLKLA